MNLELYNLIVGQLVLLAQILFVGGLAFLVLGKKHKLSLEISHMYEQIIFAFAAISLIGSMIYSDVIGFNPCKLCWYQRIFMFPIPIIALASLVFKEKISPKIYLSLAVPGFLISFYHAFSQLTGRALECGVIGQSANCGDVWVKMFGYITIPVMAGTGFAMIILACLYKMLRK